MHPLTYNPAAAKKIKIQKSVCKKKYAEGENK